MTMKLFYILIFIFAVILGGYLIINNFSFDNETFSNYLINTLFVFLLSCVGLAIAVTAFISIKRKSTTKGIMTIREYYEYKTR